MYNNFEDLKKEFTNNPQLQNILKDYELTFEDSKIIIKFKIVTLILTSSESNGIELKSGIKLNHVFTKKIIKEINKSLYGDYLKNENDITNNNLNNVFLDTNNSKLNETLQGGIEFGKIYQLYGPSLSGKSYFLNNLIITNFYEIKNKIIFFDTNNSFTPNRIKIHSDEIKNKIIHIKIFDLHHLVEKLKEFSETIQDFSLIIIDSLSLIANKLAIKETETQKEFNFIIKKFVYEHKIALIFTSSPYKIKDKINFDFKDNSNTRNLILKDLLNNLSTSIVLSLDYTLTFLNSRFNMNREGLKLKRFYVKVKRGKGGPIDKLIEMN